ncbi:MAG: phosphoribosylformylglycinamidine synthase subunit PurL, partial [Planctomycetes bacterium]|nr:phosphoribosylformylglycinamidine synthase subunit PurL [Planctomycetota bacterium]
NPVVHAVHRSPWRPEGFPVAKAHDAVMRRVPLRELDDAALERLSREAHLFLSVEEMRAIQAEYRRRGCEPREIELETIAQTWSEHCVHKTLKSRVRYRELGLAPGSPSMIDRAGRMDGHGVENGDLIVENLLKHTVAAATHRLTQPGAAGSIDWCLSVFVDNAGVIAFDDHHAVCMKVETHNHPSALEPYGGAATGAGGCIRDVMGTGLVARPIAATDVFCVAPAGMQVPRGCLPPARILRQVVSGVRDYGNRMGIPTLNGAVWFDPRYVGNPLVYCGVVGLMPRTMIRGRAESGDRIVIMGGRTGRDGIHGATFSSAELTDTHADEFSHAVQIGNAITQKKTLDALLAARDSEGGPLFHAVTDCGAGGFSSAVGEMGARLGAEVHLDRAPLKYQGLSPTEVWISEAQERMVLAVPADRLPALAQVCEAHQVEWCDLGTFGTPDRDLVLLWHGSEVGRISTRFLDEALPTPTREAVWDPAWSAQQQAAIDRPDAPGSLGEALRRLLRHPNISSKAWIIRQYDHEVQGTSVIKPLVGPQAGPGDAAVIQPLPGSTRGVAIGNGLATGLAIDPYWMGLAAVDECVRNLVCVGADPDRIAILDNFCWPACRDPRNMGSLVRAAEACLDAALAYRTPFISGKDSLNNQFVTDEGRTIQIPPTLLISGLGIVPDVLRCVTMDAKAAGNLLVMVGFTHGRMGGSHAHRVGVRSGSEDLPQVDLRIGPASARAVAGAIQAGLVRSAHDCSEGGALVAAAEMAFAGHVGLRIDLHAMPAAPGLDTWARAFAEDPSRYLLEVEPQSLAHLQASLGSIPHAVIGRFEDTGTLAVAGERLDLATLHADWRSGEEGW